MSRAVYEQFRVQVKQEILQKLDCGLDFSDGQVRRLIDESKVIFGDKLTIYAEICRTI